MSYQHKSPETIYQGQEAYVRVDSKALIESGEVKIIGNPIFADEVIKKVSRKGFEITYLAYFIDLFDKLGGKKYLVFKYIIEHKSTDNTLIITVRELAEKTGTSTRTVQDTLKLLKEAQLIKCRVGAIMLLPKLAHRGSNCREAYLMQKFEVFAEDSEND